MKQTKSSGVETINSFLTPKGIQRTLQVECYENGNVEIDFTLQDKTQDSKESFKCISLNRREALALVFYLIRIMLPGKFLATKWKREEKEEKKEEKQINN